jgi:hypothetical protein
MTITEYNRLRAAIIERGYLDEIQWAQNLRPPVEPVAMWRDYAWVVMCSGMKEQIVRVIWNRMRPHVEAGGSAHDIFGHKGKATAIDCGWREREAWLRSYLALTTDEDRIAWCQERPWVGPITRWHLAKNYGVDCAKPDRHLVRIAALDGETPFELCARIGRETGERVATVDLVIWRAANLGLV